MKNILCLENVCKYYTKYYVLVKNENKFLENISRFFFVKLNTVNWCKLNKIAIVQCTDDVTWVHVVMTPKSNYNFSIRNLRWQKVQCVQ